MSELKDWEKHIRDERVFNKNNGVESFCGVDLHKQFYYTDIDHAAFDYKGVNLPCPKCLEIIVKMLNHE